MRAPTLDLASVPRLLEAADCGRHKLRNLALVRVLLDTACRPGEAQVMAWGAVIDAAGAFTGRCAFQSMKGGRFRNVSLAVETVEALRVLRQSQAAVGEFTGHRSVIFRTSEGLAYVGAALRLTVIGIGHRAGLDLSSYSLRHAVLTRKGQRAAEHHFTARDLAAWSGHVSDSSVLRYVEPFAEAARVLDKPESF